MRLGIFYLLRHEKTVLYEGKIVFSKFLHLPLFYQSYQSASYQGVTFQHSIQTILNSPLDNFDKIHVLITSNLSRFIFVEPTSCRSL